MEHLISIQAALELPLPLFVDLRSPIEYEDAHIPGALNIPLFDNLERAEIGTIYREISQKKAAEKGLEIVAPKLPGLYSRFKKLAKKNDPIIYCWRGGMRSKALSRILAIMGVHHYRLEGGYKSFRNYVVAYFSKPLVQELIVLDGLTGVGKTELLEFLREENYPVLNLEKLADNRGSVFGHIGYAKAATQKQFEGRLFTALYELKNSKRILVECESRRIGRVSLPTTLYEAMQKGRRVLVCDSFENRIERLVRTYARNQTGLSDTGLREATKQLTKQLGKKKVNELLHLIDDQDYRSAAIILLKDYYDPLYHYPGEPSAQYDLNLRVEDREGSLLILKDLLKNSV